MTNSMTIFKREFGSYFNSPIAYIFIIAFCRFIQIQQAILLKIFADKSVMNGPMHK